MTNGGMMAYPKKCDQCQWCRVNGIFVHELHCPNQHSRWDAESGVWIKQRKCFTCGYVCDADDPCCDGEQELLDIEAHLE